MTKKIGIGGYAFLGLMALIVVLSIINIGVIGPLLAIIFAIGVALLNVTAKETLNTLMAALVLALGGMASITTALSVLPMVGSVIAALLTNIGTYFLVIGVIVAIKEITLKSKN